MIAYRSSLQHAGQPCRRYSSASSTWGGCWGLCGTRSGGRGGRANKSDFTASHVSRRAEPGHGPRYATPDTGGAPWSAHDDVRDLRLSDPDEGRQVQMPLVSILFSAVRDDRRSLRCALDGPCGADGDAVDPGPSHSTIQAEEASPGVTRGRLSCRPPACPTDDDRQHDPSIEEDDDG